MGDYLEMQDKSNVQDPPSLISKYYIISMVDNPFIHMIYSY